MFLFVLVVLHMSADSVLFCSPILSQSICSHLRKTQASSVVKRASTITRLPILMLISRRDDDGEARDRVAAFLEPSSSLLSPHASSNSLKSYRDSIWDLCRCSSRYSYLSTSAAHGPSCMIMISANGCARLGSPPRQAILGESTQSVLSIRLCYSFVS
jgi:hypothetical protein